MLVLCLADFPARGASLAGEEAGRVASFPESLHASSDVTSIGAEPLRLQTLPLVVFPWMLLSCKHAEHSCPGRSRVALKLQTKPPCRPVMGGGFGPEIHAQNDWTTGVPDNGNDWRKFRVAPHSHPLS